MRASIPRPAPPSRSRGLAGGMALPLLAALLLSGCDSIFGSSPEPTTITITPTSVSFDAVGETASLSVEVLDQDDQVMEDVTVDWSSSNPQVAGVSATGVVTSAGNGNAQITATAGSAMGSASATVTQVAASLELVSGDGQTGPAGEELSGMLVVEARDRLGAAAVGVGVRFSIEEGDGSVSTSVATTGADGRASVAWTLGTQAGAPQRIEASLEQEPGTRVEFQATAVAGPPDQVEKLEGDAQTAQRLSDLPEHLEIRVTDRFGNPVPDESVTFAVVEGGGSVDPAETQTDGEGRASTRWTLGASLGDQSVSVTVASLSAVTFSATAVAIPAAVEVHGGDGQSGVVAEPLDEAPAVRVLDETGLPVPSIQVRFEVMSGGGTVEVPNGEGQAGVAEAASASSVTVSSNADGVAAVGRWILGTAAGPQALEAVVGDLPPAVFMATADPGPPHALEKVAGDQQTGEPDQALSQVLVVLVEDEFGNPVPGVTVGFAPEPGSGSADPSERATDMMGMSSTQWTLGSSEGTHTLVAGAAGLSVSFTATADAAPPPPPPPPPSGPGYNIQLVYVNQPTAAQEQAFDAARGRWESLITGDLTPVDMNQPENHCGDGTPAINQTVDDVLIYVILEFIDGPGGVLGSAGPCWIRTSNSLTIVGRMRFDTADLDNLEAQGRLGDVILHEMGHVFGIGTLWNAKGFLQNPSLQQGVGADTHFNGPQAITAFDGIGGDSYTGGEKVPVENELGGGGTRDSHWRQTDIFENELMTGFLSGGTNPLSVVTVASLADLGYEVNLGGADPFTVDVSLRAPVAGEVIHLMDDIYDGPIRIVDEEGNFVGFFRR